MSKKNPKVDGFFTRASTWRAEMTELRAIVLGCPVTEELKWGKPCYTFESSNVAIIQGFKEYCALLFPKGALLKDPNGILVQQTENVQAARQLRFTTLREIVQLKSVIKSYVNEAIAAEKAGLEVTYKRTSEFKVPAELKERLDEDLAFKRAFEALTPGRQRGYLLYFGGAKQSKTRETRIEKCIPRILKGKGLQDA
ncbi:MAG TPA: DUF1801 domain-containing protein [Chthoniobacterales bacterium]|nr:DUF1801 domain-containing protein [Chthoniobacterales bacterium]